MEKAKIGDTVQVHYTGKLNDGTIFDSSVTREPLEFKIGDGRLIPDFESAVVGMNVNESKTIKIESEKAYGPHIQELVVTIERDRLPLTVQPEIGQHFQLQSPDGRTFVAEVTNITEKAITFDANHPLAGKDLIFDIELVAII
ncbi:MAG: peptidylprolyl isomerase [Nitrospirae bacterium]|jgi:peptidylprolyl isomerase|nr:peptidylprolyl isomerase [Nitrospirota bacterium]